MLWDVIRDFFVHFIFGGYDSQGSYFSTMIGQYVADEVPDASGELAFFYFPLFQDFDGFTIYVNLADYLCTIATIISIIVIVVLACLLIKKIYNICAHVIG